MKKILFRTIAVSILLMGINAKGFCADNAVMIDESKNTRIKKLKNLMKNIRKNLKKKRQNLKKKT